MPVESITFPNADGDDLSARLDLPDTGAPQAFVLFAHCFTCSKNLNAVGHISRALTRRGFGVFRFDFTGLGESEGDFSDTNFSSNVEDLVAAARYLEETRQAPSVLLGHSLGGAAVLQAAREIDAARAVATIGAPHDPEHVTHLLEDSVDDIERTGEARVALAGRTFTVKKQFLDDLGRTEMRDRIRSLDRALMILHSPVDQTVGIDNAARIFEDARHPKSFVSLDRSDHLLTREEDSRYVGIIVAAWASKYLEAPMDAVPDSRGDGQAETTSTPVLPDAVEGTWTATGPTPYRTEVRARTHRLVADEPTSVGGADDGPTPYELLLAGLGACTGMTLRMYADRKDWPLESATVRMTHEKIHATDCAECETEEGKLDRITRKIDLEGDLTDTQRSRLLEIANKCPVHRTLHSEVQVLSSLADAVASS